ncbi:hypothetical protein TNCV_943881 [Trichonephila clavipes]|nr:hypothetical protein TNCV_943881 [Trichonephila clavipes]
MFNPPIGQHGFFRPTREASKTDHTEFFSHSLSSLLNYLRAFGDGPVAGVPGGQGIQSWLACLEFEPSATKDPPYDVFPPSPCLEFLDILIRCQGSIWWPAEQKICRQVKITSEEHLGWGIGGGLVSGTPVGKQEKGQLLVPVLLITGYERDAVQNGPIEPLYYAVRLRM